MQARLHARGGRRSNSISLSVVWEIGDMSWVHAMAHLDAIDVGEREERAAEDLLPVRISRKSIAQRSSIRDRDDLLGRRVDLLNGCLAPKGQEGRGGLESERRHQQQRRIGSGGSSSSVIGSGGGGSNSGGVVTASVWPALMLSMLALVSRWSVLPTTCSGSVEACGARVWGGGGGPRVVGSAGVSARHVVGGKWGHRVTVCSVGAGGVEG